LIYNHILSSRPAWSDGGSVDGLEGAVGGAGAADRHHSRHRDSGEWWVSELSGE
jgi:hypothetical protein